jgi:DNA-binding response OmpR family regulator
MYIGLLEDEPHIADCVRELLEQAKHTVRVFDNGDELLRSLHNDAFDLLVLDWWVPGRTGLQVLTHLRNKLRMQTPALFLTARTDPRDIISALGAGADDYCTKPIHSDLFMARVGALLRRTASAAPAGEALEYLGYRFQQRDQSVHFSGQTHYLTDKEFRLALCLFENAEKAISRKRLMLVLWGQECDAHSRSLDVHICTLRKKLHLTGDAPTARLRSIYGYGYRLNPIGTDNDGL